MTAPSTTRGTAAPPAGMRRRRPTLKASRPIPRRWYTLSDDELLNLRMCDLPLPLKGSALHKRVQRLYAELGRRGLSFRPHVWLSSEWFSPDGVPGIALPFYLAHPRLMRLERRQMLQVEGGSDAECMKILRHEAGHAIDNAYGLHRRRRWQKLFGLFSEPYPDSYKPRPYSRRYVLHLDWWYAQSHPAEDFAETFAVWLTPGSNWRERYAGWPALEKLKYVDQLMSEIAQVPAIVQSSRLVEPMSSLRMTLRTHYRDKRMRYADEWPDFYDRELLKLFSDEPRYAARQAASVFLSSLRPELRRRVSEWTGEYAYVIDQVLRDMIDRCRELRLRLARPVRDARIEAMIMVTVQTMNFLHSGQHRLAL